MNRNIIWGRLSVDTKLQKVEKKALANKFYKRSGYLSIVISGILLALYLALGHNPFFTDLIVSEWFLDLLPIPLFLSTSLSGLTYLGGCIDLITDPKLQHLKPEKILTALCVTAGIALGITLSVLMPIAKTFFGKWMLFYSQFRAFQRLADWEIVLP